MDSTLLEPSDVNTKIGRLGQPRNFFLEIKTLKTQQDISGTSADADTLWI